MPDSRNLLAGALKKYHDSKFTPGVYEHSIFGQAALLLERADIFEVFLCGECRFVDTKACPMSGSPGRVSVSDFCSYGERRTE